MTDGEIPSVRIPKPLPDGVSQATIGVRGGLLRSGFEETSEAIFLNIRGPSFSDHRLTASEGTSATPRGFTNGALTPGGS